MVNYDRNESGSGICGVPVMMPAGVTGVEISASFARPSFSGWDAATVSLQLRASNQSTVIASLTVPFAELTTAARRVRLRTAVSASTLYFVCVVFGDTVVYVGDVQVKPTISTDTFWGNPFTRFAFHPSALHCNARRTAAGGYYKASPMSYMRLVTTADSMVLEFIETASGHDTMYNAAVLVNGEALSPVVTTSGTQNIPTRATVTFPATLAGQLKVVDVVQGGWNQPVPAAPTTPVSSFLTAVYLASSAQTQVVEPRAKQNRLIVIGDSVLGGGYGLRVPALDNPCMVLRRALPTYDVICEAFAATSLYEYGNDAAGIAATMTRLKPLRPTHVLINLGTNDYGVSLQTAANYQTDLQAFVQAMKAAWPWAVIQCMSPIRRDSPAEGTNNSFGAGNAIADYRTAMGAVVTAESLPAIINGLTTVASADLSDGVHPGNSDAVNPAQQGVAKIVTAILAAFTA